MSIDGTKVLTSHSLSVSLNFSGLRFFGVHETPLSSPHSLLCSQYTPSPAEPVALLHIHEHAKSFIQTNARVTVGGKIGRGIGNGESGERCGRGSEVGRGSQGGEYNLLII